MVRRVILYLNYTVLKGNKVYSLLLIMLNTAVIDG